MTTTTQNNGFKAMPRPVQFNVHAWDTLKKYAMRIWSSYNAGVAWTDEVRITCKEFYDMLKDENGALILDPKLITWVPNQRINNWFRELKQEADLHFRLGHFGKAQRGYEQMIMIKSNDYNSLCRAAECAAKLKDYQRVMQILNSAILKYPLFDRAFVVRAELFAFRDEDECALKDLNKALNLRPSNHQARLQRAMVLRSLGSFHQAVKDLDILLKLNPEQVEVYLEKALILEELDDMSAAYQLYRKALRFEPFNKEILYRKAQLCVLLNQNLKKAKAELLLARDLGHPLAEELFLQHFVKIDQLGLKSA